MNAVYLIPLLPLIGFALLLCGGKALRGPAAGWLATVATGSAFVASVVTFARSLDDVGGQVVVFFVLVVAAAEVVVGLGIIVALLRRKPGATADDVAMLKG